MKKEILGMVKYNSEGLIPVVVQDCRSEKVLMVAYMNEASLQETIETGQTVFFSRSRKALWKKGQTSGNFQSVREILIDCDEDTLLIKVEQINGACHTGRLSCFYRKWEKDQFVEIEERPNTPSNDSKHLLDRLSETIVNRKEKPSPQSYVSSLFSNGEDAILKKVAEEAGEVLISSKNRKRDEIVWEVADLWFHTLVLLGFHGLSAKDIFKELEKREGRSGIKK